MEPKLYNVENLAFILKLHSKTVIRFIHEGKIKARKIGRAWMVSESDLKDYCHCELADEQPANLSPDYETIKDRINVSAVIEITEQNSEEASRISNSFMAMLNSEKNSNVKSRFDFFYYPEAAKAKYVFYGSPEFIKRILDVFSVLSNAGGVNNE